MTQITALMDRPMHFLTTLHNGPTSIRMDTETIQMVLIQMSALQLREHHILTYSGVPMSIVLVGLGIQLHFLSLPHNGWIQMEMGMEITKQEQTLTTVLKSPTLINRTMMEME